MADELVYRIVYKPPSWYDLALSTRDRVMSSGTIIDIIHSQLHSLQPELLFYEIERPWVLILVNVEDRYDVLAKLKFPPETVLRTNDWSDVVNYVHHLRPRYEATVENDGRVSSRIYWEPMATAKEAK